MRTRPNNDPRPCSKCGGPRHWTGSRWRCSPCYNAWQKQNKAAWTPEQMAKHNQTRTATRQQWTPERRAHMNSQITEWREANRERHRAASRAWYWRDVEERRAAKLAEYRRDPSKFMARNLVRKARKLNQVCDHGPKCVTVRVLDEIYASACLYCGKQAEHADHFIPLAKGGLHCRENIVPACGPCNMSKKASDPFEWLERLSA